MDSGLGLVDVSVSTGALNFTSTTWNIPQEVTVTAVDDSDVEGSHTDSIILVVFTINEASPWNADAIDPPPLTVNITDNDPATLTVIKTVITDDGGTAVASDWTMDITGTDVSNASFAGSETGVTVTLDAGAYSVSESGGPSGYAASLSADCSGTIAVSESKTCTIENDDIAPELTVIKTVITDDGGTASAGDWTMNVNGTDVSNASFAGSETGVMVTLDAGTYSVSESGGPSGYTMSLSADCSGTIALGESLTCTITNNDIGASLTVIKTVITDDGGTAVASDWTMDITGGNPSDTGFAGSESGLTVALDPGSTYSVSESGGPSGYALSASADCSGTIALGESLTCTITNDDIAPTITLTKVVDNGDGGDAVADDFALTVGGSGVQSGVTVEVAANTAIALDETLVSGYDFVSISGDAKCPAALGGTVTLDEGENISCTITNDDIAPTITLTKVVDNGDGGDAVADDFALTVGGAGVQSGVTVEVDANTAIALDETLVSGYDFVSISGDAKCPAALGGTVTLDEGENISCTMTNDDIAPTITLTKNVVNDDGGDAVADDFALTVGGAGVQSGVAVEVAANTPIALDETLVSGYDFVSISGDAKCPAALGGTVTLDEGENISCTITNDDVAPTITLTKDVINSGYDFVSITGDAKCPTALGGTVTLDEGENISCTMTNDDIAPAITLTKDVINDDGGDAVADDFALTVGGAGVQSGVAVEVAANTPIALDETLVSGYDFVSISGDAQCPTALGGTVTLDEGENISCTITNDDITPTLTVVKHVVNDDEGTAVASDWTMDIAGTEVSIASFAGSESGVTVTLDAGAYSVSESGGASGYAANLSSDCSGTIDLGDSLTCTITNDDFSSEPGFSVSPGSLTTSEDGTIGGPVSVVLTGQPSSPVTINVSSGDVGEVSINTASLTFSLSNWFVPQQVGVNGVDDGFLDGNQLVAVTFSVGAGSDSGFLGLADQTV